MFPTVAVYSPKFIVNVMFDQYMFNILVQYMFCIAAKDSHVVIKTWWNV